MKVLAHVIDINDEELKGELEEMEGLLSGSNKSKRIKSFSVSPSKNSSLIHQQH